MDPSLSSSTLMDPLNTTDSSPCMLRLSSLASITLVRSDHLPSWSLWRRCCSLGVALSSCSRCNLSLISVELHGEESFVAQKFQHVCKFEMHVYLRFRSFNLNFRYMASCTYADRHTHMSCNVVKLLSAKVLLQCAVISVTLFSLSHMFIATVCRSEPHLPLSKLLMFNIVLQSLHDI